MELLLGCGNSLEKRITFDAIPKEWSKDLVRLDWDETCNPDVVHDLNIIPYPFDDNLFDEIHAYEILEHCGRQGDYRFFFDQFSELHRILKPGGYLCGTSPKWEECWAWADPGHTRIIAPESMIFLSQRQYEEQVGKTPMADYRFCYEADFELVSMTAPDGPSWGFVLKAIKEET